MTEEIINAIGEDIYKVLNDALSINIIRCKECKWYRADEYSGIYRCYKGLCEVTADDFCSHGEKRKRGK